MHLTALKLQGFKSFADPTVLRFEPGVTAVVGPNGCGKSNIADAIRWVLGEQSAKALRGGKMQDVIFEGTDSRKPSQLCEVSLVLTDCEKQLGSEFHEIEIMRRVYRDGQGEYFFNNKPCRLKDIQKLFMDTGVGRTSYSIMAQGQIDQILSSKPEERRAVFEEAAGITKYKSQRKEALQKLTLTDQNLARVSDVINEVSRQINSLKRQASKALRFKKLSYRLRHLALAYQGQQHSVLSTNISKLEQQLSTLRASAETHRAQLTQQQTALDEKKSLRSDLNNRVQQAQQNVFDLRTQKEQAENAANLANIKRTSLTERIDASKANLNELEMQIRELATQVDTGSQDKQQQLTLLGTSDATFQNHNRELSLLEAAISKLDQELQQTKFALLQQESAIARLRTDCSAHEVDQKTSAHKHEILATELSQIQQQHTSTEAQLNEFATRIEEAHIAHSTVNQRASETQTQITKLTADFKEAQRKLQEIDRQLAQRTARLKLLQQLQQRFEGFGEGSKALLQGALNAEIGNSTLTPLTNDLEAKPALAKAVETLLGSAVEAIHVVDLSTAQKILSALESRNLGSAILHVGNSTAQQPAAGNIPAFLTPATDALLGDSSHPAAALLSACYITENLPAFIQHLQQNPDFPFLAVATPNGQLIDRRGIIIAGAAKNQNPGILQREADIRQTTKQLADDQLLHDAQRTAIEAINTSISSAERDLEEQRQEIIETTKTLAAIQSEERNLQRTREELSQKLAAKQKDLHSVESSLDESKTRFERANQQLTEAATAVEQQKQQLSQIEVSLNERRAERDIKRDTLTQARMELAEQRQKVAVIDKGIADMQRRRSELEIVLTQRRLEIETWTTQITELETETSSQKTRAEKFVTEITEAQTLVETIRTQLLTLEKEIDALDASQKSIHGETDKSQHALSQCEILLTQDKSRALFIEEDVRREFQVDISQIEYLFQLWRSEDDPPDLQPLDLDDEDESDNGTSTDDQQQPATDGTSTDATAEKHARRRKAKTPRPDPTEEDLAELEKNTDFDALKTEISTLRQRISNLGAVNTAAIEEYAELKQRFDFLRTQSGDLTNAKNDLLKTIDEINQTSLQQFQLTFDQIKKNFAYTFQTLFGGGVANLELIVTDDILESGIEITAQPPGTKLKSITLLSGGQKTLTAVALLFALYMVKPSPFCLLDELDAPLDESNIGRFTDLLKKFVTESQFIIITHNKRTVSAAHDIYGVTMEERGVSKIVSMRFNQTHDAPEPAPISESLPNRK